MKRRGRQLIQGLKLAGVARPAYNAIARARELTAQTRSLLRQGRREAGILVRAERGEEQMETEAKFIVPDEASFAGLNGVDQFGPYTRRDTRVKQVHDRYVDTQDRSFYRHNLFVRLRDASDDGMLLTIKGLGQAVDGAIHSREEHEAQVPGLEVAQWPEGEVRSIVEHVGRGKPFTDLFTIDQTRTVSNLYQNDRLIAEMSLDNVLIYGQDEPVRAYELEVELRPEGLLSDLRIISRLMSQQYHLLPQPQSKFERAMDATGKDKAKSKDKDNDKEEGNSKQEVQAANTVPMGKAKLSNGSSETQNEGKPTTNLSGQAAPPVPGKKGRGKGKIGVLPTDSALAASRKIVGAHFKEMLAHEEGTRDGTDPEELHDMRVATRRMRAVFRVLGPYMSKAGPSDVLGGLRDVAHAQGAVRDLDVLIEHAQAFRNGLPAEQQADMDGLVDDWCSTRDAGRKKLVALLDSKEYARFRKRMQAFLDSDQDDAPPNTSADVRPYQVRHIAGSALWNRYEAVRAYETVMDAPTLDQLHALRITGKYLRYALECFQEVLDPASDALVRDVTKMQDQLGNLHDADVAAGLVREYMDKQGKSKKGKKGKKGSGAGDQGLVGGEGHAADGDKPTSLPGLAAYLADREGAIRSIMDEFGPTWQTLNGAEWRARFAKIVSV